MNEKNDFDFADTQDLLATQKLPSTQDLDETQLVQATQDETQLVQATQKTSRSENSLEGSEGSQSSDNLLKEDVEQHSPLKDVSNQPQDLPFYLKKADFPKPPRRAPLDDSDNLRTLVPSTDDIPDTEEVLCTQTTNISVLEENDLTPEMSGMDIMYVESKNKVEKADGVALSHSSVSSGNPESSSSGTHPSSSQLSSSDNSLGASQPNDPSTPSSPKKTPEVNMNVTPDLFSSQEAGLGELSLPPQKTASQENEKKSEEISPIPGPRSAIRTENINKFKVPLKTNAGVSKTSEVRRSSRDKLRRRAINDLQKASPPLDSQEMSLRMSGSSSETDLVEDANDDVLGTPDLAKTMDYSTSERGIFSAKITPEEIAQTVQRECVQHRDTVESNLTLQIRTTNNVNCKVIADPNTGEVILLNILNIEKIGSDVKQIIEPTPFWTTFVERIQRSGGGCSKEVDKDESWKVTLSDNFHEDLEKTLTACFQKQITCRLNNVKKPEALKELPTTPVNPSGRIPRKRKLSTSATEESDGNQSTKKATPPLTSPFKRPRGVPRLSVERENTPKKKLRLMSPKLVLPLKSPPETSVVSTNYFLQEGTKVFAKWAADKMYYPADVVKPTGLDHWLVRFHDDKEKELAANSICVVNTFEINQPVLAQTSKIYKDGIVVEVKAFDRMDEEYVVKLNEDGSLLELPRDKLSLSEQMVQIYKQKAFASDAGPRGFPSINLENVVHGKRTRSTTSPCPVASTSTLKSGSGPKPKLTTSESSSYEETDESTLKITGIEPEEYNPDPLAWKSAKKTKGRKKTFPDEETLLNEFGPIPEDGSNLFLGLTFILTCATKHVHETKGRNNGNSFIGDDSENESASETECFCESFTKIKKTMSKSRLAEQITAGGGRVERNLDALDPEMNFDNVFFIANRPSHTAVYLHCLALGIKGILFDAIIHCCKKGLNFKEYLNGCQTILDIGFSIKEKRLVAWNEFRKASKPFIGVSIHVYSKDKDFVKFWEKILGCAGAQLRKLRPQNLLEDVSYCTVVVAEPPVSGVLKTVARDLQVPIVSVHWIIQSLIHHRALPDSWHSDFLVDSDDSY